MGQQAMTWRSLPLRRIVLPACTACIAVILLSLSAPRLMGDLASQPGNQIKAWFVAARAEAPDVQITPLQLATWEQSRRDALALHATADGWSDLALIAMLRARLSSDPDETKSYYLKAREDVIRALAANPNSGLLWLRRAIIDFRLREPPAVVLASLETSIAVAPYEPGVFFNRMIIGYHYWPILSPEQRELVMEQIPMMAAAQRWNEIKRLARLLPQHIPEMRARLENSPRALAAIERAERLAEGQDEDD